MLKIKRFEICHWVQEVGDCAVLQLWYFFLLQLRSSEYLMMYQLVYGLMSFVGCVSVGAMRNRLSFVRYHTCIAFSFTSFLQAGRRRLRLLMTLLLIFPWGN
jgi:hypothetical protein